MDCDFAFERRDPWNKGKLVGQKTPFRPKEIWAIRVRLQMAERSRELALFNLGIDYSAELGPDGVEVHFLGIPYPLYEALFPDAVARYWKK
jgi:hypothetical protein